jgi:hypothetical protein
MKGEAMKRNQGCLLIVAIVVTVWMGGNAAFAQSNTAKLGGGFTVKVDCNKKGSINAALTALSKTGMTRGVTITVTGTCHEDVLVQGFDRLTLLTTTGATIEDPSGGTSITIDIEDSHSVTLQGFTVNGGVSGVLCGGVSVSVCYLTGNTIQSSLFSGVLVSTASSAILIGNVVQNNFGRGMTANLNASAISTNDTFRSNASSGIVANQGYVFATTLTIENNSSDGSAGILALNRAAIRIEGSTITGNGGAGSAVQAGSEAWFDGTNVTGNSGDGVVVKDLSFVRFDTSNITGNLGGTDVSCRPQFPTTRGARTDIGGGVTNCVEP